MWVERPPVLIAGAAGLGDPLIHPTDADLQSLGFDSVGVALTIGTSLMRLGLEHLLWLDMHRMIHECGESRGHGGRAVLDEQGREVVDRRTFILVGHRGPFSRRWRNAAIIDVARSLGLSLHDAAYLEVARRLALPLATLDKCLRRAVGRAAIELI